MGSFDILPWLPLVGTMMAAVLGGLWILLSGWLDRRAKRRTPLPPTWPEMWARMDKLEQRMEQRDTAFAHILSAAADQWPKGYPGPVFDKVDLEILEDTIPPQWRIRATG